MNPIAEKALQRATLARQALYSDPVVAPVAALPAPAARSEATAPAPEADAAPWDSRNADKFVVRLPEGMRAQLADKSKDDFCSMNTVCVRALRNELENHAEHRTMMQGLKLLERQLQAALAVAQGGK